MNLALVGLILSTCTLSMYTEYLLIEVLSNQKLHSELKQGDWDAFQNDSIDISSSASLFASRKGSKSKGIARQNENKGK